MRPHASGRGSRAGIGAVSLDENLSSGNPADARARIVALPSPSPTLRLFWCRLDPVPRDVETLGATLSPYEWTRAGRFSATKRLITSGFSIATRFARSSAFAP